MKGGKTHEMVLPSLPRLRFESRRLVLLRSASTATVALVTSSTAGSSEVAWRKLGGRARRTLHEREDETMSATSPSFVRRSSREEDDDELTAKGLKGSEVGEKVGGVLCPY